jgi:hypothetical protein
LGVAESSVQKGRGAPSNPAGRFERLAFVHEPDDEEDPDDRPARPTELFRDTTKSILAFNDSPDVPMDASINPYRGCEHGCIYCYARPYHEYLGLSAGEDFESKIFVKENAAALLREALSAKSWTPQVIGLSGVTDPYQPVERKLRITRACLEVLAEFRNPVAVITKNHLVTRDIDILASLAEHQAAQAWNASSAKKERSESSAIRKVLCIVGLHQVCKNFGVSGGCRLFPRFAGQFTRGLVAALVWLLAGRIARI